MSKIHSGNVWLFKSGTYRSRTRWIACTILLVHQPNLSFPLCLPASFFPYISNAFLRRALSYGDNIGFRTLLLLLLGSFYSAFTLCKCSVCLYMHVSSFFSLPSVFALSPHFTPTSASFLASLDPSSSLLRCLAITIWPNTLSLNSVYATSYTIQWSIWYGVCPWICVYTCLDKQVWQAKHLDCHRRPHFVCSSSHW